MAERVLIDCNENKSYRCHMIPKKSGIYQIINQLNDRRYIGSATNLYTRFNRHMHMLRMNKHINQYLQNDFNKCGEHVFTFEIIEYCAINKLHIIEQEYLDVCYDECNSCYNIKPHVRGSLYFSHSEETKKKMSLCRIGIKLNEETKKKMSEAKKREWQDKNYRKKMIKLAVDNARRGEKSNFFEKYGSESYTAKTVFQYALSGEFLKEYGSIIDAAKDNIICKSSISSCCRNLLKKAGDYMWSFEKKLMLEPYKRSPRKINSRKVK